MATSETRELLVSLVAAFGDADRIRTLLAPDAQWWISPTVGILASPTVGRDSICESLQTIFGGLYADVRTTVHHLLVDDDVGTARFTMFAKALFADGRPYENEYCVWIQIDAGAIIRVWEYLDVAHAIGQFGLPTPGSFSK
jgi:ketosteroid isomerase-like protein